VVEAAGVEPEATLRASRDCKDLVVI